MTDHPDISPSSDECPKHGRYVGTNCTYCDWPPLTDAPTSKRPSSESDGWFIPDEFFRDPGMSYGPIGVECENQYGGIKHFTLEEIGHRLRTPASSVMEVLDSLKRLASMEAMTNSFALDGSPAANELRARINYAEEAIRKHGGQA